MWRDRRDTWVCDHDRNEKSITTDGECCTKYRWDFRKHLPGSGSWWKRTIFWIMDQCMYSVKRKSKVEWTVIQILQLDRRSNRHNHGPLWSVGVIHTGRPAGTLLSSYVTSAVVIFNVGKRQAWKDEGISSVLLCLINPVGIFPQCCEGARWDYSSDLGGITRIKETFKIWADFLRKYTAYIKETSHDWLFE